MTSVDEQLSVVFENNEQSAQRKLDEENKKEALRKGYFRANKIDPDSALLKKEYYNYLNKDLDVEDVMYIMKKHSANMNEHGDLRIWYLSDYNEEQLVNWVLEDKIEEIEKRNNAENARNAKSTKERKKKK